jgi:ribonucleoside-diphosphate reductase alpha chain
LCLCSQKPSKFTEYFVIHKPFKDWIINFSGYFNGKNKHNVEYVFNNEMTEEILKDLFDKSPWGGATAGELSADQHIEIQRLGQKYTTHSISKTINLPESASVEEVSDLYLNGWKANLKGLTIYRDNCRAGIMVKSDTKECDCKTSLIHNAPKRPKVMTCDIKRFRNGGEKWIAAIGLMDGKPYEIFTGLAEKLNIPEYITKAEIIKTKINKMVEDDETGQMVEKKVSRYDIRYIDNNGEKITIEGLSNVFNPIYHNYSKLISGLLRHGMGVQYIISTIKSLNFKDDNINTWKNGVIRSLKVYMEDGEIKGEVCPSCGSKIQRINGCKSCVNCGWSACS